MSPHKSGADADCGKTKESGEGARKGGPPRCEIDVVTELSDQAPSGIHDNDGVAGGDELLPVDPEPIQTLDMGPVPHVCVRDDVPLDALATPDERLEQRPDRLAAHGGRMRDVAVGPGRGETRREGIEVSLPDRVDEASDGYPRTITGAHGRTPRHGSEAR